MLQPGSQIGRYEIQRRLGRGGMGTVYVAHDPVLGRMVAIKVFATDLDLPDAAHRFVREARSAASLNHPHIVTVHDYGDVSSQPFIVMEHVQGETMAEAIRRRAAIPLTEKLRWIEELCAGAAYAHRSGVLHRDIKPTNLMINRAGQLKILDFGIARMMGTLSPKATALVGTPGYMAPEQILGEALDHRADLFSIGVVCYELLAYTEAFPGETLPTITHRILTQEPVPLSQIVPDLDPDLIAVVNRSLRKTPAERFEDVDSMRAAISRIRRQLDSDSWEAAPTVIADRPSGGVGRRGTGSERRPVSDAVGVAQLTPPPDSPRTDREQLARRRAAQIAACLNRSRALLAAGDAEAALDACLEALTFEETHADALELEQTIHTALATRRAEALIEEATEKLGERSLTAVQGLLLQVRELAPENADLKRLERELRLARVDETIRRQRAEALAKAIENAQQTLARGDVETALASAREALALDPDSARARELEAEALRRIDENTAETILGPIGPAALGTVPTSAATVLVSNRLAGHPADGVGAALDVAPTIIAPPARKTPPPAAPVKVSTDAPVPAAKTHEAAAPAAKAPAPAAPAGKRRAVAPAVRAPRRDLLAELRAAIQARPKKERVVFGWAAAAIAVIAVVTAAVVLMPAGAAPPTGVVTIDAVPWATITRIEGEDGTVQPLPSPASTPFALTLPAGTYTITLAGPPPELESRVVTAQVQAGGTAAISTERFRAMTPDEYFESYLTVAGPAASGGPLTTETASGPAGAALQGVTP
jgi:tRNA A-37 threonylcarbamoyl transferase component Bud32